MRGQAFVHHLVEPAVFCHVALESIPLVVFVGQAQEVMHLPRNRTEATHLEHEPLVNRYTAHRVLRQKLAGLFGQVQQNGTRFKHAHRGVWRTIRIDDGRDFIVGTDL